MKMRIAKKMTAGLLAAAMLTGAAAWPADSFGSLFATPMEAAAAETTIANPFIYADVPDPDIIRVDDTYYMVSTTMFFAPGAPIMKSKDLVSWEICNYVYDTYADGDVQNLANGKHDYAHGQWATSLRYKDGVFYAFFGSYGSNKSYIYKTTDIENGTWTRSELNGMYHDASMLLDDDGRNYLVYGGGGEIKIKELNAEMTGFKNGGLDKTLFKTGLDNLAGEGSHVQKIGAYYYVFVIAWPSNHPRIELCYRSKEIGGYYEGKTVLESGLGTYGAGVAQGGIVDTPDGEWYGVLFQDHGSVGRIPVLVPVNWQDNWPMMGINGKAPTTLTFDTNYTGAVLAKSDDFSYNSNDLQLEWQWNHNPDNKAWSVTERDGYLRLHNEHIASNIMFARNTLTMRTEGPSCASSIKLETTGMKPGDYAGLSAFQFNYGNVGVRVDDNGSKYIYMSKNGGYGNNAEVTNSKDQIIEQVPLSGDVAYLKEEFTFATVDGNNNVSNNIDKVSFFYSTDGNNWTKIGDTIGMTYDLKLFTGYRSAIYSYPTKSTGGYADIDYFDYTRAEYNAPQATAEPLPEGYLFHDTFENGQNGWSGRGSASVAGTTSKAFEGSKSIYVTGREAAWNGASKKLSGSFKAGQSYSFSSNVMFTEGDETDTFYMKLQYTGADNETYYDSIAEGTANKGQWVQLANTNYEIPAGATNLVIYVETAESKNNFYVDDVVGAVAGTEIEGAEKPMTLAIGDVNFDGVIDIFDLGLAKAGLINGFKDKAAEKDADVDQSGEVDALDIVYLCQFIHGLIDKFPVAEKPEPPKSNYNYPTNITYHESPAGKDYTKAASQSGKVTREYYDIGGDTNTCLVYTPPGYDPSKKYNILYLMHGGNEKETTIIEEFKMNNILDNMIVNGELEPIIMVCPNFNKCSAQTFYKEWRSYLIPFIETRYSTYADGDVTEANLKATRYHRAYGGFSMGAASTWAGIVHGCMEICAYWMPLSGDNWEANTAFTKSQTVADEIDRIGLKDNEFFIIAATGDDDLAYPNMKPQYEEMYKNSKFKWGTDLSQCNSFFLVAPGKTHWWGYVRWYIMDTLPIFFHENQG